MIFRLFVCLALIFGQAATMQDPDGKKIVGVLQDFVQAYNGEDESNRRLMTFDVPDGMLMSKGGLVTAEVVARDQTHAEIVQLGHSIEGITVLGCFEKSCSFRMHISLLETLADHEEVALIVPNYVELLQGSVESGASRAMFADTVREELGVSGKGSKVCVLSDSFNFFGNASLDSESGDLPPLEEIEVVRDLLPEDERVGSDEGRAMMQLVHDVAPGAKLAFHTAFLGASAMAEAIISLAKDYHCNIIVDDIRQLLEGSR